jgi:hypothetical protein
MVNVLISNLPKYSGTQTVTNNNGVTQTNVEHF